jgi:hypothetical protein
LTETFLSPFRPSECVPYIAVGNYILMIEDHMSCAVEVVQTIFDGLLNVSDVCNQI